MDVVLMLQYHDLSLISQANRGNETNGGSFLCYFWSGANFKISCKQNNGNNLMVIMHSMFCQITVNRIVWTSWFIFDLALGWKLYQEWQYELFSHPIYMGFITENVVCLNITGTELNYFIHDTLNFQQYHDGIKCPICLEPISNGPTRKKSVEILSSVIVMTWFKLEHQIS